MPHKYLLLVLMLASFFTLAHKNDQHKTIEQAITQSLDQFHHAAAEANASVYLGLLTSDAIFLAAMIKARDNNNQIIVTNDILSFKMRSKYDIFIKNLYYKISTVIHFIKKFLALSTEHLNTN